MDNKLTPMSLLPSALTAPMTPAARVRGTAVSAAALSVVALGAAFGIDPGPPRGAPV